MLYPFSARISNESARLGSIDVIVPIHTDGTSGGSALMGMFGRGIGNCHPIYQTFAPWSALPSLHNFVGPSPLSSLPKDGEIYVVGGSKNSPTGLKVDPATVPYVNNSVPHRQCLSKMSGCDQINPATVIELECCCVISRAAADQDSPREDFV